MIVFQYALTYLNQIEVSVLFLKLFRDREYIVSLSKRRKFVGKVLGNENQGVSIKDLQHYRSFDIELVGKIPYLEAIFTID